MTRSQNSRTLLMSCVTKTIVVSLLFRERKCSKHLRWNAASPTASTSSMRRMSARACVATEKAMRTCIPEE